MRETKLTQIMEVKEKSLSELKAKYEELFDGEKSLSTNKVYLWRKIAYRLQEREYGSTRSPEASDSSLAHHCGGLSAKAKQRLKELIGKYDPVNNKSLRPDRPVANLVTTAKDKRLPIPGTVITKEYKGSKFQVKVLEKGFEYNGKIYRSLTAVAKEITGAHWNGYLFFNL